MAQVVVDAKLHRVSHRSKPRSKCHGIVKKGVEQHTRNADRRQSPKEVVGGKERRQKGVGLVGPTGFVTQLGAVDVGWFTHIPDVNRR